MVFFILPAAVFGHDEQPQDLEPLVITRPKQSAFHTYTSFPSENNAFNYQSGIEELAKAPIDLQSRSLGAGIQADFSLRGSTFSQVLILLNGQRINDPQTAHFNSDLPFTKEDIQKIEVIPGAGPAFFGPDAIGGAINFLLKPAFEKKMVWETALGNQQNGYSLFSASNKYRDLGFRITVEDAQSGGFAPDTDYKKFTASASTLWEFAQGTWENNFGYQEKEFGAYDFYTPGLGYPSREWTRTYLLNSGFSFNRDNLLVKPNFLWRRHFDKFALNQNLPNYNDHRNDMFVPGIYLQKEIGLLGRAGLGLEWGRDAITSTSLGKHSRQHKSVFFDESRQFGEKLEMSIGLRWDDYSDFNSEYSGSADFKFKLNYAVSFNLGISRSVRVPSFTELYYNDVTTIGNPDLSAERAWNYQAGFKYQQEDFSTGLVLFLRRENQMIDWVSADPLEKWQARNFTSDKVFGAEYCLHKKFNSLLSLDAHYTYTEKVIDNQGYLYKYGPNYARHLVNTVFNLNLPFGRQEIGFNYKKRPGRRGWLLLDAGLSYNLNKNSKIFLSSKNLLNVEYQDIAGIPQSGRYLQAGLRLDW